MANEKRLIDKDALIKLCDAPHWCVWMSEIEDFPTVDAVEVKHGHWVDLGRNYYTVVSQCSECGAKYDFRSPYCPNCGAKMDGDGNG